MGSTSAINAAALYLALAHIIADCGESTEAEPRPSFMMLTAAGLSLLFGLVPQPFVTTATAAEGVLTQAAQLARASRELWAELASQAGIPVEHRGLWLLARQSAEVAAVAHMSPVMLLATVGTAIGAAVLAGLLPTWRACQVVPAIQLKTQ